MSSGLLEWVTHLVGRLALVWLAALVPILIGVAQLEQLWTHTDPPWGWLVVAPLPLIGLALALSKSAPIAWRFFTCLSAAIAFIGSMMLYVQYWPAIANLLLASTVPALAGTLPGAIMARPPRLLGRATLVWTGLVLGLGLVAAFAEEFIIARNAEAHANGRPYCLQFASQKNAFEYEPVKTLFDLNGMKMRARLLAGGSTMFRNQHHAWLVIEGQTFLNWSYMTQSFRTDVGGNVSLVTCKAEKHFAKHLPTW